MHSKCLHAAVSVDLPPAPLDHVEYTDVEDWCVQEADELPEG